MSTPNPDITVSDIISDVETRLGDTNLDIGDYLPWISHAYQKLFNAISSAGQRAREELFGDSETFNLSAGVNSYNLLTNVPRFGGFIRLEVKYGGDDDEWVEAKRITSVAYGRNQDELTSTYQDKKNPRYRKLGNSLIITPAPPSTDTGTPQATVWYVKRPYQLDDGTDVIDIPYRFTYPIADYVYAKATLTENEDVGAHRALESDFDLKLKEIVSLVVNEFNEYDGTGVIAVDSNAPIFKNPLR